MSLAKVPAILIIAAGIHIAILKPAPTTPKNRQLVRDFPTILDLILTSMQYACWLHAAIELALIFTSNFPAFTSFLLPNTNWNVDPAAFSKVFFSPLALLGASLVLFGSALRYLCFIEMGSRFTYHVTLLPNHMLVTTGPYSIVRHPSYTGAYCLHTGLLLYHFAPGAWLRESGAYRTPAAGVVLAPFIILFIAFVFQMFLRRTVSEDAILKKQFGREWEAWAARVRYRLVPGIFWHTRLPPRQSLFLGLRADVLVAGLAGKIRCPAESSTSSSPST